jgi:hypothetical protein
MTNVTKEKKTKEKMRNRKTSLLGGNYFFAGLILYSLILIYYIHDSDLFCSGRSN